MGLSARGTCAPRASARPAGSSCRHPTAVGATPATSTGVGPAASARPSGGSGAKDDGAHLPHLWAGPDAMASRALHALHHVLACPRRRVAAATTASAAAVHTLRTLGGAAHPRLVPRVLYLLASPSAGPRATGAGPAPLPDLRAPRARAAAGPLFRLLPTLAPARPRPPAAAVAALSAGRMPPHQ
jgi:hypothetical protein